jgi:hypothetical protein
MLENMPSIRKWMKIKCFQSYQSHEHQSGVNIAKLSVMSNRSTK